MPRKVIKKERGIFEKEPGSDIWWIRYYIVGRERRGKVGRRGDALKLHRVRKTDDLRGVKLPANMKHKDLKFEVIGGTPLTVTSNTDARMFAISSFE